MKNSRNKNNKTKNNFVKNQKSQKFQEYKKNNNDLAEKSLRIVMGLHSVKELFKVRQNSIVKLMLRDDWNRSSDLVDIYKVAERNRIKIEEVSAEKLNKIGSANQGVVAYSNQTPEFELEKIISRKNSTIIALDGVEDPHNFGAIIRTAWLMGVDGIIIPEDRAVGLVATTNKVACGGVEHVPIYKIVNFAQIINTLKENGYWVYGLSFEAKDNIFQTQFSDKKLIIFGAEDKGMRKTTESHCDALLKIPQKDNAASYNVSVSVAICLSEAYRQCYTKK